MILKNSCKIKAKKAGLKIGDEEIPTDDWFFMNSFTVSLPKNLFYVKVPMVDWGEECPSCLVGLMDDDWGEEELKCENCGWMTPWVYTNMSWKFVGQKKTSK
jgi:hypothetical protein